GATHSENFSSHAADPSLFLKPFHPQNLRISSIRRQLYRCGTAIARQAIRVEHDSTSLRGGLPDRCVPHQMGSHMNGKPHVMVVDDDLSMCNFLRSFLADRGYSAITMGNAEEAVKRYHAERPAAVILDVVMPGTMDGLDALAAFKKIDRDVP